MKKYIALFLAILALSTPAQAFPLQSVEEIPTLINDLLNDDFPELKNKTLKVGKFYERDSFFQSNFEPLSLFSPHPVYIVEYNPRLYTLKCPRKAVKAILAHELSHTLDYVKGGVPGIIGIGAQLIANTPIYEHRTDLQAIFRGYGEGLILYREWIYPQLNAQDLKRKKAVYYKPHEIELLMAGYTAAKSEKKASTLLTYWLNKVPMNTRDIYKGLRHFDLL